MSRVGKWFCWPYGHRWLNLVSLLTCTWMSWILEVFGPMLSRGSRDNLLFIMDFYFLASNYVYQIALLRQKPVGEIHASPLSVHVGRDKTTDLLEDKYYWPKLCPNVARYVERYHPSQKAKGVTQKASLYMPFLITNAPWENLSIDFGLGLPRTQQGKVLRLLLLLFFNGSMFVIIDHFLKWLILYHAKKYMMPLTLSVFLRSGEASWGTSGEHYGTFSAQSYVSVPPIHLLSARQQANWGGELDTWEIYCLPWRMDNQNSGTVLSKVELDYNQKTKVHLRLFMGRTPPT